MNKSHLDTSESSCRKQLGFADGYGTGGSILHPQLCLIPCHEKDFMLPRSYMIILQARWPSVSFFSFVSFWPFCSLKDKNVTLMCCIFQESKNERKIGLPPSEYQPWVKQSSSSSPGDFEEIFSPPWYILNKLIRNGNSKLPHPAAPQEGDWRCHCLHQPTQPHSEHLQKSVQDFWEQNQEQRDRDRQRDVPGDLLSPFLLSLLSAPWSPRCPGHPLLLWDPASWEKTTCLGKNP